MVSAPGAIPVTTPEREIVASGLDALQAPPMAVSASVISVPIHTEDDPVIVPGEGVVLISIT